MEGRAKIMQSAKGGAKQTVSYALIFKFKLIVIKFFLKQNMAFRQNFIYKVKGIFAVSVLFCSRTSSALITTRPEVLPSLHRALFTSRHGRPPFMGLPGR